MARWRRLELDSAPVVARQASTVREAFEDLLFTTEPDPPEAGPGAYETGFTAAATVEGGRDRVEVLEVRSSH